MMSKAERIQLEKTARKKKKTMYKVLVIQTKNYEKINKKMQF